MTNTLTRELIDSRLNRAIGELATAERYARSDNAELKNNAAFLLRKANEEIELCILALQALDMQPRPIEEALEDDSEILALHSPSDQWILVRWQNYHDWYETTTGNVPVSKQELSVFIPLSSLPKETP